MSRLLLFFVVLFAVSSRAAMPAIEVSPAPPSFRLAGTKQFFIPWGFNYDRDRNGRLLENYWHDEWDTVAGDFREMKALGANVVRVHLQFGRFMRTTTEPNEENLRQLTKLLTLAEQTGLYIDLTGLGCYDKSAVPPWYDALDEAGRWQAQAHFWEAVAGVGANSSAIFCYDLMNEPVVANGRGDQWLGPEFGGKCYVQYITRDPAGRARPDIARQWVETLTAAIHRRDHRHLITVGLVDWSLDRPGLNSGMLPSKLAPALDFLCVHLYPRAQKTEEDLATLALFAQPGKPLVIEETAPLFCGMDDFTKFIAASRPHAQGWISFYWGQSLEELDPKKPTDALIKGWLEFFRQGPPKK